MPELAITSELGKWMDRDSTHLPPLQQGEVYVVHFLGEGKKEIVVEREMNVLTLAEAQAHEAECVQAMLDELKRWHSLGSFKRFPRRLARNVLDSRWVLKWKLVDGKRIIKARLTVRGYKDSQANSLNTFAGTTTRWGQRVVNQIAAQYEWDLFIADVSQAFLRGLTFEQAAQLKGEVERDVQFETPPGSIPVLRMIEGFEDFDSIAEVLAMLRCGFGLKDAPRLWNKVLVAALEKAGLQSVKGDSQLFVKHVKGQLVLIVSTHVDDLKGAGLKAEREQLLAALEKEFGKLKTSLNNFEHVGIMHEQDPVTKQVTTHQQHYLKQLKEIKEDAISIADDDEEVSLAMHQSYMSLLGAMAWMTLTCPASCVYIVALQKFAKKPLRQNM